MKYKVIKKYPGGPSVGTIVRYDTDLYGDGGLYYFEDGKDYFERIEEKEAMEYIEPVDNKDLDKT